MASKHVLIPALAAGVTMAGCATLPKSGSPEPMRSANELQLAKTVADTSIDERMWPEDHWWTAFGDPQLDRLEAEALAANPTLAIAKARLDRAVALAGTARSALSPDVAANAKSTRERFSEHDVIPPPYAGSTQTASRMALDFSYELDFWGKNRAALAAALDRAHAAKVDAFAARLLIATAVARTYVQLARVEDHLEIARDTLAQRERIYELTRQRVDTGLDSRVELKQAEGEVPAARQDVAALEESAQTARNQLAALLGAGPDRGLTLERPQLRLASRPGAPAATERAPQQRAAVGDEPLPQQPDDAADQRLSQLDRAGGRRAPQQPAAVGGDELASSSAGELTLPSRLPADLLGRRPDVLAARLRVQAAAHDIDVARARFYPDIDLLGFLGFQSIGLSQLADAGSRTAGVGPALHLPIFDGGRLRSDLAATHADYDAAVAQYNATLIEALRELANELAAFRSVAAQRGEQRLAMAAAREAYDLAMNRYRDGIGNYLTVLSAESQVLKQRHLAADLRAREFDNRIELARTLGGGFEEQ